MRLSMVLSLLRPAGPVVVGISLGFTLSLLSVTWVEDPCGPRFSAGQGGLSDSGHDVSVVRKPNSFPMENNENFEPKIIPYTPPDPQKAQKKPVR
ncbi:hypothetical protein GDO81_008766 [Engystomops pustulosus]|uniref:Uncharacterized protein n=2 Tax=Engystomops pustulosus TaxID=76066 RepID=A0AAV7CGY5_ENGPU|nr:hypothetical protein GDO81_008766 [Engystomops pustulosus]